MKMHIVTVHWNDPKWIDVQHKYIQKSTSKSVVTYAFLNGISEEYDHFFDYVSHEHVVDHATKLNLLADMVKFNSDSNDYLVFIDGDAFPIANLDEYLDERLAKYPIVAVKREENNGDCQPHPCFCATTVGFWTQIKGDWKSGYKWKNKDGNDVTDVGGNLLGILKKNEIEWYPMMRSNKKNIHPLWFGIYDNMIYHHGAGFRNPISRNDFRVLRKYVDRLLPPSIKEKMREYELVKKIQARFVSKNQTLKKSNEIIAMIKMGENVWPNL